jgi:hypothetical protein
MRARRREVVDEYVEDGRAAVYSTEGMVLLLSELATAAWGALGSAWVEVDHVADALVDTFGAPPDGDPTALTAQALTSLADLGLVDLEPAGGGAP